MRFIGRTIAIPLLFLLAACGGGEEAEESTVPSLVKATPRPQGEAIPVGSDPHAQYTLISWEKMPNGNRQAVTQRDGPSGTSFARREIDCQGMNFRYLGEGNTKEEALQDSANIGEMAELSSGSISTEVSTFVCSK